MFDGVCSWRQKYASKKRAQGKRRLASVSYVLALCCLVFVACIFQLDILQVNDRIVSVNGAETDGMKHEDILALLMAEGDKLTFQVVATALVEEPVDADASTCTSYAVLSRSRPLKVHAITSLLEASMRKLGCFF